MSWRAATRLALRLAIAHHPLCPEFAHDRTRLGGFCTGCVVTWPAFWVSFFVFSWAPRTTGIEPAAAVAGGLLLGVPQVVSVIWRGTRGQRLATKLLGGIGLGAVIGCGLWLPFAWWVKIVALVVLGVAFAGLLALRMQAMLRRCDACVWQRNWAQCPGFKP